MRRWIHSGFPALASDDFDVHVDVHRFQDFVDRRPPDDPADAKWMFAHGLAIDASPHFVCQLAYILVTLGIIFQALATPPVLGQ